jgi:hypothetical protein
MLSVTAAIGFALVGLPALPGRADDHHSTNKRRDTPKKGKDSGYQQGSLSTYSQYDYPPAGPYRSAYLFPKEPPARPRPDQVRDITLYDNYFSPSYLMVPSGMTVRFTNKGSHPHTTSSESAWESGEIRRGGRFSLTFTRPGKYYYHCRLHRNMTGVIVVY